MTSEFALSVDQRGFLATARTAVLATIGSDGRPRLVPICFVLDGTSLWSPLDEKDKLVDDLRDLARVRDLLADPRATLLVERWSEDWDRLGWLRLVVAGELVEPGSDAGLGLAIAALRAKYAQYATHDLEHRPMLRLTIERALGWGNLTAS